MSDSISLQKGKKKKRFIETFKTSFSLSQVHQKEKKESNIYSKIKQKMSVYRHFYIHFSKSQVSCQVLSGFSDPQQPLMFLVLNGNKLNQLISRDKAVTDHFIAQTFSTIFILVLKRRV